MALRIEVISSQRQQLGTRASIVLGVAGGSIGRALDNDWALPDTQRYLSGHHARIHFRSGTYFLEDTSTNGVFVNDASTPQGRRGLCELHEGDLLRMGEYRLRVHMDDEDAPPVPVPPGTNTMAQMAVDNVVPLRAIAGDTDLGASLNIEALIPPDATGPVAKLGSPGMHGSTGPLSAQQRLTRLRAAARARLEGNGVSLADMRNALQAFCKGAGINPEQLPMENEAQTLHLIGRLMREALLGLRETLRAQQALLDRYDIDPGRADARSPVDQSADEYLLGLLTGHERHQLDAVMELREQFRHASGHDAAIEPAVRQALEQFLAHLSPARLKSGGTTDAATLWNRYNDLYGNLMQATGQTLPHLFIEAINQAYLAASRSKRD